MELFMNNVSVRQKGKQILSDVSALIKPGINAVIGDAGAGKTAMLRSVIGLLKFEGYILKNRCGYTEIVYQPQRFQTQKRGRFFEAKKCQRLGISQSLDDACEILVLDEPMAGMSLEQKEDFRKLLLAKKESDLDKLILVSSKDVTELESICDRCLFLHKGKMLAYDAKEYLYEKYQANTLKEVFLKLKRDFGIL